MPLPPPPPVQQQQEPQTAPALQQSYQMPGYGDFANDQAPSSSSQPSTSASQLRDTASMAPPFPGRGSDMVFPQKLHALLTASEQNSELAR